jgi:drug/metabolite transporter (DMT)-like permease
MLSSPLFLRAVPVIFTFLWSTGWVVAGYSARYADALTFLLVRYACAGVLIVGIALAMGAPWPRGRRAIIDCVVTGCCCMRPISAASGGRCAMACRQASPG